MYSDLAHSIDNRSKVSLLSNLQRIERDLISHNHHFALLQAYIRTNGVIPSETLELIGKHNLDRNYFSCEKQEIDEYLQKLSVTMVKKNGESSTLFVYTPSHNDVAKHDALDIHMLDKSEPSKTASPL